MRRRVGHARRDPPSERGRLDRIRRPAVGVGIPRVGRAGIERDLVADLGHRVSVHPDAVLVDLPVDDAGTIVQLGHTDKRDLRDGGGERKLEADRGEQAAEPRTRGDDRRRCADRPSPVGLDRRSVAGTVERDGGFGFGELGPGVHRPTPQRTHPDVREHGAGLRVEQRMLPSVRADLREARGDPAGIELIERRVAGTHAGGEPLELGGRAEVELAGQQQDPVAGVALQPAPSLHGLPRQLHVDRLLVREADRSRRPRRGGRGVAAPEPIDAHHVKAPAGERQRRREPDHAEAYDGDVGRPATRSDPVRHASPSVARA